MASKAVKKQERAGSTVSPEDEPSAEWGWHGRFPKAAKIAAAFVAFAMFAMLIGNHSGKTADFWLIGLGTGIVVLLLLDLRKQRTSWRR